MRGGRLDKRMTIQQGTDTQTTSGDITTVWADLWPNVPCRLIQKNGGERFEGDRDTSRTLASFEIRWRSGLNPKMRIIYNSNTYDIIDIDELGRNEGLIIKAYTSY